MTDKMFIYYAGTIDAFKQAALEAKYTNSIVFITGDVEGNGAAIYTHGRYFGNIVDAIVALKYFSKISANGITAEAAGNDGTITFSADDPASVAVKVDEKGVHFGLTEAFKTAVNTTLPNRISAIEGDYLTSAEEEELINKINTALAEAKKYTDDEISEIIVATNSDLIGSAEDTSDKDTIYGAKKYADEKATAAQAAAEATAASDATSKVNAAKEEIKNTTDVLEGRIADNESAISTLNGEGEGSIKKAIDDAFNDFSAKVSDDQVVNTYKELIDYAATHGAEFTELVGEVSANKIAAETGIGEAKAAAKTADDKAVAAQGTADANAGRLTAIESDYLKSTDKTELQGNIDAVSAVANAAAPQATTYTKEEVNRLITDNATDLSNYYTKDETYSKQEVNSMWEWEEITA